MRITDHRYHRDRDKLDLAIRMIRHEARTATIQAWTGLTGDRVRKLHHEYVLERGEILRRHRGKPPRQSSYFLRNVDVRRQAVALGGLYALHGLLRGDSPDPVSRQRLPAWAERFCGAYETYLTLGLGCTVTFEHAAYLLEALQRRTDLRPDACPTCNAFTIVDTHRRAAPRCPLCDTQATQYPINTREPVASHPATSSRHARITTRRHDNAQATHLRRTLP
jgi:hypothetical protein